MSNLGTLRPPHSLSHVILGRPRVRGAADGGTASIQHASSSRLPRTRFPVAEATTGEVRASHNAVSARLGVVGLDIEISRLA